MFPGISLRRILTKIHHEPLGMAVDVAQHRTATSTEGELTTEYQRNFWKLAKADSVPG